MVDFDGSSDCLHAPDNNDWEPGSGDFTMEMWVHRFRVDSDEWLMTQNDGTSAGSGVGIHIWASNVGTANQFAGRMRIGGSNIECTGEPMEPEVYWECPGGGNNYDSYDQ